MVGSKIFGQILGPIRVRADRYHRTPDMDSHGQQADQHPIDCSRNPVGIVICAGFFLLCSPARLSQCWA
jgi:hypothetical protein